MPQFRRPFHASLTGFPRLSPAMACVMLLLVQPAASIAQESGLRGTVNETEANTSALVKKPKKKVSRLSPEPLQPVARYEPADLDPNADSRDADDSAADAEETLADAPLPTRRPADGNSSPDGGDAVTANGAPESNRTAGAEPANSQASATAAIAIEDEVPQPFARQISDGSAQVDETGRAETDNVRTGAIEGKDTAEETDPFAAPGIRSGTFILRPTLEQGLRWTSNADGSANGSEAVISETNVRLRVESNWLRHSVNLEATGGFRKTISGEDADEPEFGLAGDVRLDVSTDLTVNARASWNRSEESATAPILALGPLSRPNLDTLQASLGATYDPGLFGVSATGQVTRLAYGDVTDSLGVSIPQDDRNNTLATITLRGTYDISQILQPFAEVEAGRRFYDNEIDSFGYARAANRYGVRAGLAVNTGEKLNGELAAGWLMEDVDDDALRDISGLDIRGTVNWSPQRGTNVAFTAGTTVEASTVAASSGSILYSTNAALTHKLRENLDATLSTGAAWRIYEFGAYQDTILSGEAGLTWWMNRYAGVNGRVRHERTLNLDPTRASEATSVYLGVTLRR
jgi:hypothetical protein